MQDGNQKVREKAGLSEIQRTGFQNFYQSHAPGFVPSSEKKIKNIQQDPVGNSRDMLCGL